MTTGTTSSTLLTRKLTIQQRRILILIYKFRFVTTKQVQLILGNSQLQQTQRRLNILVDKGYIAKNYTPLDRLNGRYASYYLTNLGIRLLKQTRDDLDPRVLHALYKDKGASERFIAHCIAVGDVNHAMQVKYGERIDFFSKSEIMPYEHFPGGGEQQAKEAKPDGFLRITTKPKQGSEIKLYFLYVLEEATPMFVHKKTIKQILEYVDDGEWEAEAEDGDKLPSMLMICDTEKLKVKIQKAVTQALDATYMDEDDVVFVVTLAREL